MRHLDILEAAAELAKSLSKPIIYLSRLDTVIEEWDDQALILGLDLLHVHPAVPYLDLYDHAQIISDGRAFIICDSEEEMDILYALTIGDDGISEEGKRLRTERGYPVTYNGKARVYAVTISAEGEILTENT